MCNIERKRGKTPKELENEPELDVSLLQYVNAFRVLHRSRVNTGFGASGISLAEIEAYMRLFCVRDKERFLLIIQAMDSAFLKVQNKDGHSKTRRGNRPQARSGRGSENRRWNNPTKKASG